MLDWYLNLPFFRQASIFGILCIFCFTMLGAFRSLKHSHVAWYSGFHTTPAFQIMMWIGCLPFVIPFLYLYFRRKRRVGHYSYIGNIGSRKFHLKSCEYQKKIRSDLFRYPFSSAEKALSKGYRPCNWCNPS